MGVSKTQTKQPPKIAMSSAATATTATTATDFAPLTPTLHTIEEEEEGDALAHAMEAALDVEGDLALDENAALDVAVEKKGTPPVLSDKQKKAKKSQEKRKASMAVRATRFKDVTILVTGVKAPLATVKGLVRKPKAEITKRIEAVNTRLDTIKATLYRAIEEKRCLKRAMRAIETGEEKKDA